MTEPNRRNFGALLLRAAVWSLLIAPLSGALAGTTVAYVAFRSVSTELWFAFDHGGPMGAILGFLYGLVAMPFVVKRSLWKGALILISGTVLGGIFPAIAEYVPFALLGSIGGGLTALILLIALTLSDSGDSGAGTTSDEIESNR